MADLTSFAWLSACLFLDQGETGREDGQRALETLFSVVLTLVNVMAPYTPFLTEHMYQQLKTFIKEGNIDKEEMASVHFQMLPQPK